MNYAEWLGTVPSEIPNDPIGSARESRDWYYKSRHVLPAEVVKHRMELITHIIGMLTPMIRHQRKHAIRDEKAEYNTQPSTFSLDSEKPFS